MFTLNLTVDESTPLAEISRFAGILAAIAASSALTTVGRIAAEALPPPSVTAETAVQAEPTKRATRTPRKTADAAQAYVEAGGTLPPAADAEGTSTLSPPAEPEAVQTAETVTAEPTPPDTVQPEPSPVLPVADLVKALRAKVLTMDSGVIWLRAQLAEHGVSGMSALSAEQLVGVIAKANAVESAA